MPRPQMLQTAIVASATSAIVQFALQDETATGARPRPIEMMIGPVTIGGKQRMTRLMPNVLIAAASTR